jgi:hypothetical protein
MGGTAVIKLASAVALCLIGCFAAMVPARPGWAQAGQGQGGAPDASVFQRGEWAEIGQLEGGATLSISHARYRDATVLTFALRTEHAAGDAEDDGGTTIEVIELDCSAARFRRTSAATTRRNGEMAASNAPGALEAVAEGSVMSQIAGPLCEGVREGREG